MIQCVFKCTWFCLLFLWLNPLLGQDQEFVDKSDWPLDSLRAELNRTAIGRADREEILKSLKIYRKGGRSEVIYDPSVEVVLNEKYFYKFYDYVDSINTLFLTNFYFNTEKDSLRKFYEDKFRTICNNLKDENIKRLVLSDLPFLSKSMFDCSCFKNLETLSIETGTYDPYRNKLNPDSIPLIDSTDLKFVDGFEKLEEFYLKGYYPKNLPSDLGFLPNLEVLGLSVRTLKSLPAQVKQLDSLRYLRNNWWRSGAFPNAILELKLLEALYFNSQYELTKINLDALKQLKKLRELQLMNVKNDKSLPKDFLSSFPKLKEFTLGGFNKTKQISIPIRSESIDGFRLYPNTSFDIHHYRYKKTVIDFGVPYVNNHTLDSGNFYDFHFLMNNLENLKINYSGQKVTKTKQSPPFTFMTDHSINVTFETNKEIYFSDLRIETKSEESFLKDLFTKDEQLNLVLDEKMVFETLDYKSEGFSVKNQHLRMNTKAFRKFEFNKEAFESWLKFVERQKPEFPSAEKVVLREKCKRGECKVERNRNEYIHALDADVSVPKGEFKPPLIKRECPHEDFELKEVEKFKSYLPDNVNFEVDNKVCADELYEYDVNKEKNKLK